MCKGKLALGTALCNGLSPHSMRGWITPADMEQQHGAAMGPRKGRKIVPSVSADHQTRGVLGTEPFDELKVKKALHRPIWF